MLPRKMLGRIHKTTWFTTLIFDFLFFSFYICSLATIDADGQGFCQGGFSIDFTKVCDCYLVPVTQQMVPI